MVWQFVVLPGTHTVTDTNKVFTLLDDGPASTTTLTVFTVAGGGGGGGGVPPPPEPPLLPPPPPPQESADMHSATPKPIRIARIQAISATPRG
jgi:hypothetical protein